MAVIVPAVGESHEIAPINGRAFKLAELQSIVGGYIEAVYLRDGRVMFVNEDGKRLGLTINGRATLIAGAVIRRDDVIVGDAVICSRAEAGENDDDDEEA